jgi:hypothetical protein
MNAKTEGIFAILAALLVLFSALWDPRVSVAVSILALAALGIYKFMSTCCCAHCRFGWCMPASSFSR